jgi:hypothetical protein
MKIIFLDIDGVLNNGPWNQEQKGFKTFCPENIKALNFIIQETGAYIVISSNWRLYPYNIPEIFGAQGIQGIVIGETPIMNNIVNGLYRAIIRGQEIGQWIVNHKDDIESFVILDDDNDMGILIDHLVCTDYGLGLTMNDAKRAVEILRMD